MEVQNENKQELGPLQLAWVEELESEKYKQGRRKLNKNNEYCCLGVLCEISNLGKTISQNLNEIGVCYYLGIYHASLPPVLSEKLKMYNELGRFTKSICLDGVECKSLAELNDFVGASFKQIAVIIRENPSLVFKEPA